LARADHDRAIGIQTGRVRQTPARQDTDARDVLRSRGTGTSRKPNSGSKNESG